MVNPIYFGGHSSKVKVMMVSLTNVWCAGMLRFALLYFDSDVITFITDTVDTIGFGCYTERKKKNIFTLTVILINYALFCLNESVFENYVFVNAQILMQFIMNIPLMCRMSMVKAIEVTKVISKLYSTIKRTDFQMPWFRTIWH